MEQSIRASLRLRDFYDLKPYLRKTKTKLRIIAKKGFPFWCHRHPRMKWFLVFLICLCGIGAYSLSFVWNIEIRGNEQITTTEILDCLYQNEIEIGKKRSEIDCSHVELELRERFQNMGWVSVYFHHTCLCVEVKESLYEEGKENLESTGFPYHLVANKEAIVHSIVTRAGTALVQKGTSVQPGDILVLGQCDILDDAGEVKEVLYSYADATIWGDVIYEFAIPLTEMELLAWKLSGVYEEIPFLSIAYKKVSAITDKLTENAVIILDKDVKIEKKEKNIRFLVRIYAREQIGINIPVEEVWENESD